MKLTFWPRLKKAGPNSKRLAIAQAWIRLQEGNGTNEDFQDVLVDLIDMAGYYRRPRYADWLARRQSPDGFELHSALSNARAEVVQHVIDYLSLTPDQLIQLEQAARAEQ